ncbi:MAG: AAA domain-containing protein [Candidatus Hodarchaeales archaeon]|jgi:DNA replication ATP-dependent helicase Dna2
MKVTNGLFLEYENGMLLIYDPKQQKNIQLTLYKPWNYFPFNKVNYLTPIRLINLFPIDEMLHDYETTPDTLILLNPDIIINSRAIASASACPRRAFLEFITGESKTSLPMIRGSIIHEAFSKIVSEKKSVSESFQDVIERFAFPLSYLSANLKEFTADVIPVLQGLAQSAPTLQANHVVPEMTFLSPLFGVMGRLDFWSPKELYELKTGRKIPETNTWFSDLMQTVIYMHGLSSTPKAVSKSSVIYSGEGTPVFRQTVINLDLLQRIHMARNYSYLIQFEGFIPPETTTKLCSHCFSRDLCTSLSNIFEQQRPSSSTSYQYFNHFLSLIRLEHLKNRQDFSSLWKLSPQGRVKTGKAIREIRLQRQDENLYHYICHNLSELRPGEPVILSSQGNPIMDMSTMATIVSIERNNVTLSSQSDLPRQAYLDAYSSDFLFRRLNKNLYDITFGQKSQHKAHKLVILGKKPTFSSLKHVTVEGLDPSQQKAIQLALSANDFCLIQGPAGTGKTYTIAKLIQILRKEGQSILLSAYTNTAVDNIIRQYLKTTKGENARLEIVRLGIEQAIHPEVVELSLQHKKLSYQDLLETPIVASTTSTISRSLYNDLNFDTVILDEASQMTEPSVLSAITKGIRFILVGDDKQLPPLVQSTQAEKLGLGTSLFERLRKLHPNACILLQYQYRMHEDLMDFSNFSFYEGHVQAASPNVATQLMWDLLPENTKESVEDPLLQVILDPNQPLVYVEIPSNFDRKRRVNQQEAEVIYSLVQYYLKMGILPDHIGIIAPFRGQVAEILRRVGITSGITVDTIDRFQGSDKELILLSLCTLSRPHILDERRLNVALTRAKKKLIIVGNSPTKQSLSLFQDLHAFIQQKYSLVRLDSSETETEELMELAREPSLETDISHQSLAPEDINKEFTITIQHNICILCQESVVKPFLRCPICNQAYHGNHLREWLDNHDVCTNCQSRIQLT